MTQPPAAIMLLHRPILVAVSGQTPQVITETLYALMVRRRPPVPVREIYVITTTRGADIARRELLDPAGGQFFAFCREYGIDPRSIAFDAQHILTLKKSSPTPLSVPSRRAHGKKNRPPSPPAEDLEDIRTIADNAALAQQLFGFIKQLTADPETALHCSIAGGRKTMSAYMALALTIYGRPQDRLSHVLVPPKFENSSKFFFPPRRPRLIAVMYQGQPTLAHTKDARVELAEVPFVRLREWLGEGFDALDRSVEEIIQTAQHELGRTRPPVERLILDLPHRQARFGDTSLPLRGVQLALYAYFVTRKLRHCSRPDLPTCGVCTDCYQEHEQIDRDRYVELYRRVCLHSPSAFESWRHSTREKNRDPLDASNFQSYLSRLNKELDVAQMPPQLKVLTTGSYGHKCYGVGMDKTHMEIRE